MRTIYHDLYRFNQKKGLAALISTFLRKQSFRWVALLRWYQQGPMRWLAWLPLRICTHHSGIDIDWHTRIGAGLVLVHAHSIAVNREAVLGNDCTLYHGVTIGMEFRGNRRGNPTLGNRVWIGSNACVVGEITIGDDVLIAPLAYVNFNVPDHSIVIGNPARIIPRENATEGYITNTIGT